MENYLIHLVELRKRLIHCLIVLSIILLGLLPFSGTIFHWLANPLLQLLPQGQSLIAIGITSPVFIPLKLVFFVSIFLGVPYWVYQTWTFIAAGLYENEKKLLWLLMILSSILFYVGMSFAYFIVFPLVFKFFLSFAPTGVMVMPDISEYLGFCMKMLFAFGLAFEVPVAVIILLYAGLTSIHKLRELRPYVIVIAFIVGMLLTPPDVLSQILLAIPICLLYELGILIGKYFVRENSLAPDTDRVIP